MRKATKYLVSRCIPTRMYLHVCYRWRHGKWANLRRPATLTEKLQWKKMYGYQTFHTTVSDKYAVRDWVARRIGADYLVPLLGVFETLDDLDLSRLPEACVIKATHGSGHNVFLRDTRSANLVDVKQRFRACMRLNQYHLSREPQYRDIKPRLIVEQLLTDPDGEIPPDFKLHCFHGEVEAIQVDTDRFSDHHRNFYDVQWQLLPFTWSWWGPHGPLWSQGQAVEKPPQLEEMIGVARTLSKEFDYVRVDLYDCREKVYFGELTLHHGGGWERFDPASWDLYFGNKLHLERAS